MLLIILVNFNLFSQTQLLTKKSAKVGSDIILQRDVEKYSKLYKISIDEAKTELINDSILFQGAKLYSNPPEEKEIEAQIRDDKAFYANKTGKQINNITDDEFLGALLMNNVSMKTYKEYVRKKMWISKFIMETYEKERIKGYYPTDKEVSTFIDENPSLFEEKDGAVISMIYFSFYTKEGTARNEEQKNSQKIKAEECLKQLDSDDKFIDMVTKYSDDLFSLNALPKGRVGLVRFDDPKTISSLSSEILDAFKSNSNGVIKKIFTTKHGYYIFKIDDKIKAKVLTKEESILKAQSHLQKKYEENLKDKIKDRLINELKKQIEVIIY